MYNFANNWTPLFLISLGAIFGSYLRIKITFLSESLLSKRYFGTLIANLIATFLLSFILTLNLQRDIFNHSLSLFLMLSVGFLGSLSTFSTLIVELMNNVFYQKWKELSMLFLLSCGGGLLAAFLGFSVK